MVAAITPDLRHSLVVTEFAKESKGVFHTSLLKASIVALRTVVSFAIAGALGCICNVAALFRQQFVYLGSWDAQAQQKRIG